ncbi:acyl-CoA thioesterase [Pelagerythrobacter aerophilus]|uniref:Acyl-CoA thioesterase n=1 Tax=Pelagerythrobacter aerophilus TaxID=2306995 RepID=A0A418NEF0_9SPHN|nr:thioesterase family protein [Pelagerythrobacter aerophilus]RIV75696.1 acyl-CoA thioesterase [Pelagerythrobacter aerophilus]
MSTRFQVSYPIRFAHCDPAGIAYYPRYFELCDAAVEEWTDTVLGVSRKTLHLEMGLALPTVDLRAGFSAPSRLGDWLDLAVVVEEVGRSSLVLAVTATSEKERRFGATFTQVLTRMKTMRPEPWPTEWRQRLIAFSKIKQEISA